MPTRLPPSKPLDKTPVEQALNGQSPSKNALRSKFSPKSTSSLMPSTKPKERVGVDKAMASIDPRAHQGVHKRVWDALVNPARATEVRSWVRHHPDKALVFRGDKWGESMLHWAVMSEYSLTVDLISAGIEVNDLDSTGRTPMDWLVERYWQTVVLNKPNLPHEGRLRLKAQTQEVGQVLWQHGGRTSESALHAGETWTRGSAWDLLTAMVDSDGLNALRGWPSNDRSMLHVWILAKEGSDKHHALAKALGWGLKVDEPDRHGRSPLWYAVDAWATDASWEKVLKPSIVALLRHGANPDLEDMKGESPRSLLARHEDGFKKAETLEHWLLESEGLEPLRPWFEPTPAEKMAAAAMAKPRHESSASVTGTVIVPGVNG